MWPMKTQDVWLWYWASLTRITIPRVRTNFSDTNTETFSSFLGLDLINFIPKFFWDTKEAPQQSSHNFWICVLGANVELMFGKRDTSTSGKLASTHRCLVKKSFRLIQNQSNNSSNSVIYRMALCGHFQQMKDLAPLEKWGEKSRSVPYHNSQLFPRGR